MGDATSVFPAYRTMEKTRKLRVDRRSRPILPCTVLEMSPLSGLTACPYVSQLPSPNPSGTELRFSFTSSKTLTLKPSTKNSFIRCPSSARATLISPRSHRPALDHALLRLRHRTQRFRRPKQGPLNPTRHRPPPLRDPSPLLSIPSLPPPQPPSTVVPVPRVLFLPGET